MITTITGVKELAKIRTAYQEVVFLDGKTVTETDLIQATQSYSLFGAKKLVVIDGPVKFDLTKASCDIVIIETPKNQASLWAFLNHMTVPNFRQALKDNDVQFVFIMMARTYKGDKSKLLELDFQNKQGLLATDFPTAIELFLLGL